jgi:hypothetical protein
MRRRAGVGVGAALGWEEEGWRLEIEAWLEVGVWSLIGGVSGLPVRGGEVD